MKKFLIWFAVIVIILIVTFFGLTAYFLMTPSGLSKTIQFSSRYLPENIKLSKVSIGGLEASEKKGIVLRDTLLDLSVDQQTFDIHLGNISLQAIKKSRGNIPLLSVNDVNADGKDIKIQNFNLKYSPAPNLASTSGYGSLDVSEATFQKIYSATDVKGIISALDPITIDILEGKSFKGSITGKAIVNPLNNSFVLKAHLADGDLSELAKLGHDWLSNAEGKFEADLSFLLFEQEIRELLFSIRSISSGQMNSNFVRILLDQIPSNPKTAEIRSIIDTENRVPFDNVEITVNNKDSSSFQSKITFRSKKLNIDLEVLVDINFEKTFFLKSLAKLSKLIGRISNG